MSNSFSTPCTVACQAPLSMGFPRQGYWSGLPFPSPGDLPDPGIKPMSPALAGGFFTTEPPGKEESKQLFLLPCSSYRLPVFASFWPMRSSCLGDFFDGPVVKTPCCAPTVGMGSIPGRGTKIHACYVVLPKEKKNKALKKKR